jgi:uncharacterized coiled-coil DUF342 family protein
MPEKLKEIKDDLNDKVQELIIELENLQSKISSNKGREELSKSFKDLGKSFIQKFTNSIKE